MEKAVFLFLAVMVMTGFAIEESAAGNMCWNWVGNTLVLKVSVTDTGNKTRLVNGFFFTPGNPPAVYWPALGNFNNSYDNINRILTFSATETSGRTCFYQATLSPTTTPKWEGSGSLACIDGVTNGYNLQRVDCSTYTPLAVGAE